MNYSSRNIYVDCSKGLAAILVITGHLIECESGPLPEPYRFHQVLSAAHMPLFFLLSGWFSVTIMEYSFSNAVKKASIRLLIPYIAWSSVAVAAKIMKSILQHDFSIKDTLILLWNTLLSGMSMWFFMGLFLTWCGMWLVYQVEKKNTLLVILILLLIAVIHFPGEEDYQYIQKLHELAPVFYLGFYARRKWQSVIYKILKSKWTVGMACIALIFIPWLASLRTTLLSNNPLATPLVILIELVAIAAVFIPPIYIYIYEKEDSFKKYIS